jgi:hypothetical protein
MSGICSQHQGYDPECRLCNAGRKDPRKAIPGYKGHSLSGPQDPNWLGAIDNLVSDRDELEDLLLALFLQTVWDDEDWGWVCHGCQYEHPVKALRPPDQKEFNCGCVCHRVREELEKRGVTVREDPLRGEHERIHDKDKDSGGPDHPSGASDS